jgi:hypothetical protein
MLEWDIKEALMRLTDGDSFFIPTLKPNELRFDIYDAAEEVGVKVITRAALNFGVFGLRTWKAGAGDVDESMEE